MNKTLMVLLLFIYGSMGGKILMSELSNDGTSLGQVISEAQLFFESISPQGEFNCVPLGVSIWQHKADPFISAHSTDWPINVR